MGPFYILGLTGGIGSGKSTTAAFFREAGIPVWDADEAVERLYASEGAAVRGMSRLVPAATEQGFVDREILRAEIRRRPSILAKIEEVIHPLVSADRTAFFDRAGAEGHCIVVCDVPLLFETAGEAWCDGVLVVTAPLEVRRSRVLAREGMTEAMFEVVLERQISEPKRLAKADFVIHTETLDSARSRVKDLIGELAAGLGKARSSTWRSETCGTEAGDA